MEEKFAKFNENGLTQVIDVVDLKDRKQTITLVAMSPDGGKSCIKSNEKYEVDRDTWVTWLGTMFKPEHVAVMTEHAKDGHFFTIPGFADTDRMLAPLYVGEFYIWQEYDPFA